VAGGDQGAGKRITSETETASASAIPTAPHCRAARRIEHEQIDAEEPAHLLLDGVMEAGVLEGLGQAIGADGAHGGAAGAGELPERVGEEGLADADGADDGDVFVLVEEAQRGELTQQGAVEGDARGVVPALEPPRRVEAGLLGPHGRGGAVAAAHLVGQDGQQQILVGELLLAREGQATRECGEDERELEAAEHRDEFRADAVAHASPPAGASPCGPSAYSAGGRRKRAGGTSAGAG